MLIVAAGVVADIGLQPRVRRRVWREDGKQVDSGATPLLGGTLKLADTANGTTVNVTSGNALRPKVVLVAGGEEQSLSREKP
jgi:hypothetical protein